MLGDAHAGVALVDVVLLLVLSVIGTRWRLVIVCFSKIHQVLILWLDLEARELASLGLPK